MGFSCQVGDDTCVKLASLVWHQVKAVEAERARVQLGADLHRFFRLQSTVALSDPGSVEFVFAWAHFVHPVLQRGWMFISAMGI